MNREFLYELLETASVSGFEEEIQRKVIKYARGFADEIYTDEIADVVSIVNPDADAIHMAGRGIPTTVISIPLRYMHNPAEVCSMEDVQGCIDVLAEFLCGIGSDICLKPLEG